MRFEKFDIAQKKKSTFRDESLDTKIKNLCAREIYYKM